MFFLSLLQWIYNSLRCVLSRLLCDGNTYVFHLQLPDGFLDVVKVTDLCHWGGADSWLLFQVEDSGAVLSDQLLQQPQA